MDLVLGVSKGISRFIKPDGFESIEKVIVPELNAIEFGLLNCTLGRTVIPGTLPYPTEGQVASILSVVPEAYHRSVHGPYRISATTTDPKKLRFSKSNLSATLRVAQGLKAKTVTFHCGSFKRRFNTEHIKGVLKDWEQNRVEKGFLPRLAPEVGGKVNSYADFFTLAELASTIENLLITWDISHDFARGGNVTTEAGILKRLEVLDDTFELNSENRLPVHFSGMVVGKSGEKHHTLLDHGTGVPWQLVFSVLKDQKYLEKLSLICESKIPKKERLMGNAITDALLVKEFLRSNVVVKEYKGKPGYLDYYFSS
ncbi:MAG: TIM barrel protein [Candidatus Thorarchaeota archaeon]